MYTDLAALHILAANVRAAIAMVPAHDRIPRLRSFPIDASLPASLLMGAYLQDKGARGFTLVKAGRGCKQTDEWMAHAWLQRETCVIDLTADEFTDAPDAIVVADPSDWHKKFTVQNPLEQSDFRVFPGPSILSVMYGRMLARMPA